MELNKYKLILGSQSPRRKELLSWMKIPFEIKTADLDEISTEEDPEEVAMDLAWQKGHAVYESLDNKEHCFVISSDTIVVLDQKIYGKPKDRSDAKRILFELSNRTHFVITGVCFHFHDETGKLRQHRFYDQTDVTFNEISNDLMENYLDTNDSMDKAGAYGIQGPSLTFISKLDGSYSNVVGFPLDKVISELEIVLGESWRKRFE
jgi:septum formation protein